MAKIAMFGGTFNPVHAGHVSLCRQCIEQLSLDRMIIMPAKIPPHKAALALLPEEDRIAMAKLAFADLPVTVSDLECKLEGKSYTIRTLRLLKEQYPEDELHLLIGSDMLYSFERWVEYENILKLARLVVGAREENEYHRLLEKRDSFGELKERITVLRVDVTEISSTELRQMLADGKEPDSSILPESVLAYIRENELYQPFSDTALAAYEQAAREALGDKRFYHVQCVARLCGELAEHYGISVNKAKAAGYLHDLTKEIPADDQLKMIKESAIITDKSLFLNPNVYHSVTAAIEVKQRFGITDEDVLNAIRYHTTGRAGMSLLEKIVYTADAVSYERTYKEAEELRARAFSDLDGTMLYITQFTIEKLSRAASPIAIDTVHCYNDLCK